MCEKIILNSKRLLATGPHSFCLAGRRWKQIHSIEKRRRRHRPYHAIALPAQMLLAAAMALLLNKQTTSTFVHASRMYFASTSFVASRLRMMRRNVLSSREPLHLTCSVAYMPRRKGSASYTRNLFAPSHRRIPASMHSLRDPITGTYCGTSTVRGRFKSDLLLAASKVWHLICSAM